MNNNDLSQKLDAATEKLIAVIQNTDEQHLNKRPAPNSWSVGEVGEHLIMLETLVNKAILTGDASIRPIDAKIEVFKSAMADNTKVYAAPPVILPTETHKTKESIIAGLRQQRNNIKSFIQTADLTLTPEFKHPSLGRLTQLEWVYFIIYHAERHMRQISKIENQLTTAGE